VTIGPVLMPPGSRSEPGASLQLAVSDVEAARGQLVERGDEVTPIQPLDPRDGGTSGGQNGPQPAIPLRIGGAHA
jgi:hypothetical protein